MELPELWSLTGGLDLVSVSISGDMSGDGIVDAMVKVQNPTAAYIVFGPLERLLTLPADADAYVPGDPTVTGDVNGDGLSDILVQVPYGGYPDAAHGVVLSPPAAVVDPVADVVTPPLLGEIWKDLDADGIVDYVEEGEASTAVWFGDYSTWHLRPPDLVLETGCGTTPWDIEPQAHPDADGDGVPEIWMWGQWYEPPSDCQFFRVSSDLRGTVDLQAHPDVQHVPYLIDMGDQDGDGAHDMVQSDYPEVWAAPVVFDASFVASGPVVLTFFNDAVRPRPLGVDLNGDGVTELFTGPSAPVGTAKIRVFTGGVGGGIETNDEHGALYYDSGSSALPFVEEGCLKYLVYDMQEEWIRIVNVEQGTVVR